MSGKKPKRTKDEEFALIQRCCAYRDAGEPMPPELSTEIGVLFEEAQRRVYGVCVKLTGNPELARELSQEAMLTGYRKLGEYRGEGRFSTWLYGIARGLSANAVRRKQDLLSEDGILESGDPSLGVISALRKEEREAVLRVAAAALSPLEREAIHLRYVEGLPQARITELLNIESKSGARGVLQASRRHLQKALRAELERLGHGSSFFHITR